MNVVLITQARLGSTRLPRKVLKPILGKPMIDYHLERVKRSELVSTVCVATTIEATDDELVRVLEKHSGIAVFRGSETDVLHRFAEAARHYKAEIVVRVTSDCPLVDPGIIDQAIQLLIGQADKVDYVSNTLERTYPRGQDVEVMTAESLYAAEAEAVSQSDREHVTPFIWRQPNRFKQAQLTTPEDNSHLRWTVDVPEDFELVSRVIEGLYPTVPNFDYQSILEFIEADSSLSELNASVEQKAI